MEKRPRPRLRRCGHSRRRHPSFREKLRLAVAVITQQDGGTEPHHGPVIVVMPAYNAARTLERTVKDIPSRIVDRVILVDDASRDATVQVALGMPVQVVRHPHNAGYGANQKTCYVEALRQGADIVVMLHPDGQYDPKVIPDMVRMIRETPCDLVLGSRFLVSGGPRAGGMPWWKRCANRCLTSVENVALNVHLSEGHTGYRAYSRHFLERVPFLRNSNDFVFDTQILIQAAAFGLKIGEVPVQTRYAADASSVNLRVSTVYGLKTLAALARYRLHRLGLRSRRYAN